MGQFKPMVKMKTTEPSVELKLKKGGHVAMKGRSAFGHSPMAREEMNEEYAENGEAPKKPSVADRRKAMKPTKKADGGMMGVPTPTAAPVTNPLQRAALMRRAAQMAAARRPGAVSPGMAVAPAGALPAMKKGGKTGEVTKGKPGGFKSGGSTGGVRMGNAGGFKKGGDVAGANRPANSAPAGVSNTTTGEVKKANAGGFKDGGSPKKAYATGGSVNDAGRAVAMPKHPVSQPIKNTMQSGTFKAGGKVLRKAVGGNEGLVDASKGAYDQAVDDVPGMGIAETIRDLPSRVTDRATDAVMRLLGKKPSAGAGRGFVNPPLARKAGGSAK